MVREFWNTLQKSAALLFSLTALCGPASALAQESTLSLDAVQPYSAEFEYFLQRDDGVLERAGSWTDRVTIDDGLLTRTVRRFTNEGVADLLRTVVVDKRSLAPVRLQQRFGQDLTNVYQLEFSELTLTQILIGDASQPARVSVSELGEPVVETGLQGLFALSLPLESSGEVTVRSYLPGAKPEVVTRVYHIVGQETLEVMGQGMAAWRVEDREAQWTYWVRRAAPYIVKVVHPVPGNSMATSLLTGFSTQQAP